VAWDLNFYFKKSEMKKVIYLSFITLIFLCSCKTNSFTQQRYTKLGHSSHKHIKPEKALAKESNTLGIETTCDALLAPELKFESPQPLSASAEPASAERNFYSPKKIISPLIHKGSEVFSTIKAEAKKESRQKVNSKKTFKEKAQRAAGLFDTALKIVLFAVVLAILVAIIIIIILT